MSKICTGCGKSKPLADYYSLKRGGHSARCISCEKQRYKDYVAVSPRKKTEAVKISYITQKYALSLVDYVALLQKQNGVCAICHQPETAKSRGRIKRLSVDHDHATGKVRGLLCYRCNMGIGYLQDSPERLRAAIAYLELAKPFVVKKRPR